MRLEIEKIIPNLRIHTTVNGTLVASRGYEIYKSDDGGGTWTFCNTLPVGPHIQLISKNRLIRRLLRLGISQIKQISEDKLLICCDGKIYLSDLSFSWFGLGNISTRFFQLLDRSICVTPEYVYYGEYFPNIQRKNVNIFRSKDGLDWDVIYSFPAKSIKHVHVLQYDLFSDKIWFSTGDANNECVLGFTDLDFKNMNIIGTNSQRWRCLEFIFNEDKVFWGMDTPLVQSKLISYDRKSKAVKEISEFDGPIYNVRKLNNESFIVTTAAEGGVGEWDNKAHLWYSSDLYSWIDCASYEKDQYPFLLGFGRLLLCKGMANKIIFTGCALKGLDNSSIISNVE